MFSFVISFRDIYMPSSVHIVGGFCMKKCMLQIKTAYDIMPVGKTIKQVLCGRKTKPPELISPGVSIPIFGYGKA